MGTAKNSASERSNKKDFILYLVGIGAWLALISFCGVSYPLSASPAGAFPVRLSQTVIFSITLFVLAALDYRKGPFRPRTLLYVAVSGLAASLVFTFIAMAVPDENVPFTQFAAMCLGVGIAGGYCQWLRILSPKPLRTVRQLLILGSIVPIVLSVLLDTILSNRDSVSIVSFCLLVPVSILLLALNTRINGVDSETRNIRSVRESSGQLFHEFILPLICAVALVLVTPIASAAYSSTSQMFISSEAILPIAYSSALVVLAVIWLWLKRDITLPRFYCVFLPILASVVFSLPYVGLDIVWPVVFLGDVSTLFVSLLMITTCLSVAHRKHSSCVMYYGFFGGCVYLSGVVQLVLWQLSETQKAAFGPFAVALLLLYVLMIPAFFLFYSNYKKKRGTDAATTVAENGFDTVCDRIALANGLPPRQVEVMKMLAIGRDAPYIAKTLFLSQNTVKSYKRDLYAALKIHGKQELLDLIEIERNLVHTN